MFRNRFYSISKGVLIFSILFVYLMILNPAALAQQISNKLFIDSFTCGEGWGASSCRPHRMTVDLYRPEIKGKAPLVILQHGSGGVSFAVTEKINLLTKQGYAVVVIDTFSSRGLSKSHFDYDKTSQKGGNARSMSLDGLSVLKTLQDDPRIDVHNAALVGFSQAGLVGYWLKAKNFIDSTALPLKGPLIMPKVVIAMYGCAGEFNPRFNFNQLPIEVLVGDQDAVLQKCQELKKRLVSAGEPSNINIFVLRGADHSFDEREARQLWPKNQNVDDCYIVRRTDGVLENPFLQKTYSGDAALAKLRSDCLKLGQYAGHNGNPKIGDQPLLNVLSRYLK